VKADDFVSAPDDLLAAAIAHAEALAARGYRLRIEPYDIEYPYTPFFVGKRQLTTVVVEIQSSLDLDKLRQWVRYGKACNRDTRLLVGFKEGVVPTAGETEALRSLGIGVLLIGLNGPYEAVAPVDLALQMDPPELHPKLRPLLGAAYDHFGRGQWREGFEDSCVALEQATRAYLKLHIQRGRIVTFDARGRSVTPRAVDRMTMGGLATAFVNIQTPNRADSRIAQVLTRVNQDRITVAHYKGRGAAREAQLRRNVGKNMFVLVGGLKEIKHIKD
jgi:hypothetical protein